MMVTNKKKFIGTVSLIAVLLTSLIAALAGSSFISPSYAWAAGNGSITVYYHNADDPITDGSFVVYRIGNYVNSQLVLEDEFADYQGDLVLTDSASMKTLSDNLLAFAEQNGIEPVSTLTTGADGNAVLEELDDGAYLVSGGHAVNDDKTYDAQSFLVTLPTWSDSGDLSRDITVEPKHSVEIAEPPVPEDPPEVVPPESDPDRFGAVADEEISNGVTYLPNSSTPDPTDVVMVTVQNAPAPQAQGTVAKMGEIIAISCAGVIGVVGLIVAIILIRRKNKLDMR